jgi:Cu/Ag efflux protein CusF
MRKLSLLLLAGLWLGASPVTANAQEVGHAQGEVRKVDKDAKKVTLRHGPIEELKMPGMTMVFQVKDPKMLDQLKEGETIRFVTTREGGAFVLQSFTKP